MHLFSSPPSSWLSFPKHPPQLASHPYPDTNSFLYAMTPLRWCIWPSSQHSTGLWNPNRIPDSLEKPSSCSVSCNPAGSSSSASAPCFVAYPVEFVVPYTLASSSSATLRTASGTFSRLSFRIAQIDLRCWPYSLHFSDDDLDPGFLNCLHLLFLFAPDIFMQPKNIK